MALQQCAGCRGSSSSLRDVNVMAACALKEEEEEEEAVFIRRMRSLSLLVKIEGDPINTQHAQHRSVQATDR